MLWFLSFSDQAENLSYGTLVPKVKKERRLDVSSLIVAGLQTANVDFCSQALRDSVGVTTGLS
jgi:hypothetical protein